MTHSPYCNRQKGKDFFRLLKFSGISGNEEYLSQKENRDAILKSLNALTSPLPFGLRPLIPLINHNLSNVNLEGFRSEVMSLIRQSTMRLMAVELLNWQWLTETIEKLEQESIPVILLKSAAFSRSLYPIHASRVGIDLDLLVTEKNFTTVCGLLDKTMRTVFLSKDRQATHATMFERVFQPRQGSTPTVEIHRGLTNPYIFKIDEASIWNDSRKHPAYSSKLVRILSPEDTLLHLAVHAFRDLDFCTHNLLDAHEIWCRWKPDPELLREKARQWGAAGVLYYLLVNTRSIMDTPIPETLLNALKPSRLYASFNRKILQTITQQDQSEKSGKYRFKQLISQLTFPDIPGRGLRYQMQYLNIRLKDRFLMQKERKINGKNAGEKLE